MVLLFWEILFMHYFHLTLMSNTFTLSIFTRISFNKLLLRYLLQSLAT